MIFPRVKNHRISDTYTRLPGALTLSTDEEFAERALTALACFLPGREISICSSEAAVISAAFSEKLDGTPEGYTLTSRGGRIKIEYYTYAGIKNALASLSLLVKERDGECLIPDCEIYDYPEAEHRGIMLDTARGVPALGRLRDDMILASKARMNIVHLHLADSKGVSVEMDCLPESYRLDGYYTKAEVREINTLADALALEIIPEFDMPAHSSMLNSHFPALRCDTDIEEPSLWTVCAGSEETYALYEKIIDELIRMFPNGRYFHIGGDEIEFIDLKEKSPRICHWSECRRCRAKMAAESISDRNELYYYFANRINRIVRAHGRQTVMWSDQIDCTKPRGISDDVLMQFWRVAGRGRGPHAGGSMQKQLELGYEIINSYYPNTYVDLEEYMTSENLALWRWDKVPECTEEYRGRIHGSEACAWEYGNTSGYPHYLHSLPSAILLMADKLWYGCVGEYTEEDETALTRAALGAATPDGFNVFGAIGDIFPPRTDALSYPDKVTLGKAELEECINVLSDKKLFREGDSARAAAYLRCAESTLAEKYEIKG